MIYTHHNKNTKKQGKQHAENRTTVLKHQIRTAFCGYENNPQDNYGMSLAMLKAMGEALDSAKIAPAIRAVVIEAGGRGFHAGAVAVTELQPRLEDLDREDFQRLVKMGHKLGNQIAALPIPVIGIARGGALGGGLELLLRSDFLYCLDGARFSFPEVTLGFVAAWGGTQLAARLMPFRRAQEMLLLGESINGIQAAEFGLVTASFATAELLDAALRDVSRSVCVTVHPHQFDGLRSA